MDPGQTSIMARMKLAACIEYDGAPFCGWQRQIGQPTVQEAVESAFTSVADHPISVITAGRTDTDVNASAQVVHFETTAVRTDYSWLRGSNSNLPPEVRVLWVAPVDDDFHARYLATERTYRYIILNRLIASAIHHGKATHEHRPLDAAKMHRAAQALVGPNDYSSFRAAGCQSKSPHREIRRITVERSGPWVWFDVAADSFLYHMVRNIAGVLLDIGAGDEPEAWCEQVLAARDRKAASTTAAPDGLYLARIEYPERFGLPDAPEPPRFW